MRNLTIERRRKFAGSALPVKFYIEDAANEELRIDQLPCRKLGELKNGETKTFSISNDSAKLFAIHNKASRDYCNDYYQLPTSTEDIHLTGEARINPGIGNTFIFDGNPTQELTPKKKRGRAIGWVLLVVALIIGSIVGNLTGGWISKQLFSDAGKGEPQTFTAEGMQITLTDSFSREDFEGYTACYSSKNAAVFTLKESFTLMEGLENYTLEDYGQLVLDSNGLTDFELQTIEGVTFFEYEATGSDNNEYYYFSTVHKAPDAFWLVQFAVPVKDAEDQMGNLLTWAKSVSFPL